MSKLSYDLYRYTGKKKESLFLYFFKDKAFRFQYFYRKSSQYKRNSLLGFLYHTLYHRLISKYGSIMEDADQIGPGLKLLSWNLVCVNANTKIGKNCTLSQGITIGVANRGRLKGCPTLGDNVWVGPYVVVVGKINIGNNVWIAPNSYVNIDVPDNSRVFGNPAQIVHDENATDGYIDNPIN